MTRQPAKNATHTERRRQPETGSRWIRLLRLASIAAALGLLGACGGEPEGTSAPEPTEAALVSVVPSLSVLPVFLIPNGEAGPTQTQIERLWTQLNAARSEYLRLLGNRTTFTIAGTAPVVVADPRGSDVYWAGLATPDHNTPPWNPGVVLEPLFQKYNVDRHSNRYVYVVVPMGIRRANGFNSGGQTINGGLNAGGGLAILLTDHLDRADVLATLMHELGHAFGLNHSYELQSSPSYCNTAQACGTRSPIECRLSEQRGWSIMSQNLCHQAQNPAGLLLPEDIQRLAMNRGAFPSLVFDPENDIPATLTTGMIEPLVSFSPLPWPTQPMAARPSVVANQGSDYGSAPGNVVGRTIRKSSFVYEYTSMWHSKAVDSGGWTSLTITFPKAVTLSAIEVHTQYGSGAHAADEVQVNAGSTFVTRQRVAVDDTLTFTARTSNVWSIFFHSAATHVVVRGLRFFSPPATLGAPPIEMFAHELPLEQHSFVEATEVTPSIMDTKPAYALIGNVPPNNLPTNFLNKRMWHSANVGTNGWATMEVTLPVPLTVDSLYVSSQHSGLYNVADEVRIERFNGSGFTLVPPSSGTSFLTYGNAEYVARFSPAKNARWRISFRSSSGYVTLRGLRFHVTKPTRGWNSRPDCIIGP